jgi:hypothetical protein
VRNRRSGIESEDRVSFELFIPKARIDAICPGQCSIAPSNGRLGFHASDLRAVGICDHAALLIDPTTKRIALRKPTADEPAIKVMWAKSKVSAQIGVASALTTIGIECASVKGRRDVVRKENLLIVEFGEPSARQKKKETVAIA